MRTLLVVSVLAAVFSSGCFRTGNSRNGNIALITVGSVIAAAAVTKSQFNEEDKGGMPFTAVFEDGFLLAFFAVGTGTAATGTIGLVQSE